VRRTGDARLVADNNEYIVPAALRYASKDVRHKNRGEDMTCLQ
jgi:hypothetical protein